MDNNEIYFLYEIGMKSYRIFFFFFFVKSYFFEFSSTNALWRFWAAGSYPDSCVKPRVSQDGRVEVYTRPIRTEMTSCHNIRCQICRTAQRCKENESVILTRDQIPQSCTVRISQAVLLDIVSLLCEFHIWTATPFHARVKRKSDLSHDFLCILTSVVVESLGPCLH